MSGTRTRLVAIETEQDAYDLLQKILNDEIDAASITIDFYSAKWARFDLKLKGEDFDSSLPSSIMKSLIEYQNTLYRVAAYVKGDKLNGNALPDLVKEGLELSFHVGPGSAEVWAEAAKALSEFMGKVTKGMGSKTKATLVLGLLLTVFGSFTVPALIDSKKETKIEEIHALEHKDERDHDLEVIKEANKAQAENQKVLAKAFEQQPKLAKIQKQIDDARMEIVRQSSRADTVIIQGTKLDGEVARTMTEAKRRVSVEVTIKGYFKVEEAADTASGNSFTCKVKNLASGEVLQAKMLDSLMSARDQAVVMTALSTRAQIMLEVHARKVGTGYRNARIVSAVPIAAEVSAETAAALKVSD